MVIDAKPGGGGEDLHALLDSAQVQVERELYPLRRL